MAQQQPIIPTPSAAGRVRLRGGVGFANTEQGKKDFLKHVNRMWLALTTGTQRDARPKKFKDLFSQNPFPFTLDRGFREKPRYYITYNTRTHNIRVKPMDFSNPSDDEFMAIEFGIPILRRDFNDFYKDDLKPPARQFSEVLTTPQASPTSTPRPSGKGRLRGGNLDDELSQIKVHYDKIKRGMEAELKGSWTIRDPQGKIEKNVKIVEELLKGLSKYLTADTIAMVQEIANTPYLQIQAFIKGNKAKKQQIFDSFSPNDSLDLIKVIISSPKEEAPSRPMTTAEARREAYR
jgi:hypothetical protein